MLQVIITIIIIERTWIMCARRINSGFMKLKTDFGLALSDIVHTKFRENLSV